jgi:hypothetical protein
MLRAIRLALCPFALRPFALRPFALRLGPIGRLASVGLLALALAACGDDKGPAYVERPVEELYNSALNQLYLENYEESARLFDEVERQHP